MYVQFPDIYPPGAQGLRGVLLPSIPSPVCRARGLKYPGKLHCGVQLSRLCALQVGGLAALEAAERLFLESGTGGIAVAQ